MCGIFGFALRKPVEMTRVFRLLSKLEAHQYPQEPSPVGGFGAGMAILGNKQSLIVEKVGKRSDSPVKDLSKAVEISEASILVGHVRMPSPQFMRNAGFRETAQPYVAKCYSGLTIVSVHNGYIENYKEIRSRMDASHLLESEKIELVDSEVIPHLFEEALNAGVEPDKAIDKLYSTLKGSMALAMLHVGETEALLHLVHNGKTRGLTVWTNEQDETLFCSRREPLLEGFGRIMATGNFHEKVLVAWGEEKKAKLSFKLEC